MVRFLVSGADTVMDIDVYIVCLTTAGGFLVAHSFGIYMISLPVLEHGGSPHGWNVYYLLAPTPFGVSFHLFSSYLLFSRFHHAYGNHAFPMFSCQTLTTPYKIDNPNP